MKTVKQIRLDNLERLVAEFGRGENQHGGIRAVANLAQTAESHLCNLLHETTTPNGGVRGIGDVLARKLEKGTGKPVGWMDADSNGQPVTPVAAEVPHMRAADLHGVEIELLLNFRALPMNRRDDLLLLAERWHAESSVHDPDKPMSA